MDALEDVVHRLGLLEARVAAIPPQSPQLNTYAQLDDVSIADEDVSAALADGDVATYVGALGAWTNKPPAAGGRVSGYYVGGSPVSTSVPTASVTNLAWPTFTIGSPILDLSTIDTPITQSAGEHTIEATVAVDAAAATGTLIIVLMRITDGTTPYGAEVDATIVGSATNIVMVPLPLTAVVAAGSTVEILALQTSGGAVDVRVDRVAVTGPPPP